MRKINYGKITSYAYYLSVAIVFFGILLSYFASKQIISANDEFASANLSLFVKDFYPWAMTISAGLAVIMLIYSGYLFVTSAGNMEQVNKAKEYIVGALSGLAFLMLAAMILRTIQIPDKDKKSAYYIHFDTTNHIVHQLAPSNKSNIS